MSPSTALMFQRQAIALIAAEECFHLPSHTVQPSDTWLNLAHRCKTRKRGGGAMHDTMTTWIPRDRIMVQLQQITCTNTQTTHTIAHIDNHVYFCKPEFSLTSHTPTGTVIFAMFTIDDLTASSNPRKRPAEPIPRLLLYDVAGHPDVAHVHSSPNDRYTALRCHIAPTCLAYPKNPNIIVHWVGFYDAAHKVFTNNMGHVVEDIVCLTETPGQLVRPLRVHVPQNNVRFLTAEEQKMLQRRMSVMSPDGKDKLKKDEKHHNSNKHM